MKQYIILVLLIINQSVFAQSGQNQKHADKVNIHKIAFITERVSLTESEAQKFWPIYNSYQNEKEILKTQGWKTVTADMSEKEAEDQLNKYLDIRNKEGELQRKFIEKIRNIISAKKVLLLIEAERAFKVEILSKMSDKCKPGS